MSYLLDLNLLLALPCPSAGTFGRIIESNSCGTVQPPDTGRRVTLAFG